MARSAMNSDDQDKGGNPSVNGEEMHDEPAEERTCDLHDSQGTIRIGVSAQRANLDTRTKYNVKEPDNLTEVRSFTKDTISSSSRFRKPA